jgi:hypothetical protein
MPVETGGYVRVSSGLWATRVLWVKSDTASGVLYGFVAEEAVQITAGAPLEIDVRGIPAEHFLAPAPGAVYSGGERPIADTVSAASVSAAPSGVAWMPDSVERWMPQFEAASLKHGVDVKLIAIVTLVESGGNPLAQSPSGAMGLMQIMPATGQDIARIRGIQGFSLDQLWSPETNIDFGAWYLAQQLSSFGVDGDPDWQESVELAASAYNGGPGTVQALLGNGRSLPGETERYRAWVGGMWSERGVAQSATFEAWWWAGGSRLVESARAQLALR